ncbi:MAG: hypothetical protein GY822_12595 [Deltaproteobacteria bacterium]|nr:hypothetical protein [Deltaproteobacteria bacterium]
MHFSICKNFVDKELLHPKYRFVLRGLSTTLGPTLFYKKGASCFLVAKYALSLHLDVVIV